MNIDCPICGKSGLTDYNKSPVVCPQCNSDLKGFYILNLIFNSPRHTIKNYPLLILSSFSLLFLAISIIFYIQNYKLLNEKEKLENIISVLKKHQKDIIIKTNQHFEYTQNEISVKYIVKKGDCLYEIAKLFYNDATYYKKIQKDNDLISPYNLKVGQVLKIKLKIE